MGKYITRTMKFNQAFVNLLSDINLAIVSESSRKDADDLREVKQLTADFLYYVISNGGTTEQGWDVSVDEDEWDKTKLNNFRHKIQWILVRASDRRKYDLDYTLIRKFINELVDVFDEIDEETDIDA